MNLKNENSRVVYAVDHRGGLTVCVGKLGMMTPQQRDAVPHSAIVFNSTDEAQACCRRIGSNFGAAIQLFSTSITMRTHDLAALFMMQAEAQDRVVEAERAAARAAVTVAGIIALCAKAGVLLSCDDLPNGSLKVSIDVQTGQARHGSTTVEPVENELDAMVSSLATIITGGDAVVRAGVRPTANASAPTTPQ